MEKIEGIEACLIPTILETEENAREVVYEVVRIGRKITPSNVINEIVYRKLGVIKDEENLPHYRKRMISVHGEKVKTLDKFVELYGDEKRKSFHNIKSILILYAFGEGCIRIFDYIQSKLNKTKKQRTGGEKLNDAWIFVHTARTAGFLYENGATPFQVREGFSHDGIEEPRDWRIKQREKARWWKTRKLQREIKNPPEYREIYELFVDKQPINNDGFFGRIYNLLPSQTQELVDKISSKIRPTYITGEEIVDKAEVELMIYHLRLLTRWTKESYETYVKRMINNCLSKYVKTRVESLTSNPEEQMNFYAAPLIVKAADSLDNTIRLPEEDMPDKKSRLNHNVELLGGIYEFLKPERIKKYLGEYIPPPQILVNLSNKLINASIDGIANIEQLFEGDSYLGIKADLKEFEGFKDEFERFREMYSKYEPASELVAS